MIAGAEVGNGIAVVSALRMGRGGASMRACWVRAVGRRRRRNEGGMDCIVNAGGGEGPRGVIAQVRRA